MLVRLFILTALVVLLLGWIDGTLAWRGLLVGTLWLTLALLALGRRSCSCGSWRVCGESRVLGPLSASLHFREDRLVGSLGKDLLVLLLGSQELVQELTRDARALCVLLLRLNIG